MSSTSTIANPTKAMAGQSQVTSAVLGSKFIRWGLWMFVVGFVVGFIPILHYMLGAIAGDVGHAFLKNITLWWGCPAILIEYVLKTGGVGMVAVGICYRVFRRANTAAPISGGERLAPTLCLVGLVAATVYAGVGYVVCNVFWPNFYFEPIQTGKNVWLAGQGIGIAFYVAGIVFASGGIRRYHLQSEAVDA